MNEKCPVCGRYMYLTEMTTKDMTWLCLNCMWVYLSDGFGKQMKTLLFEKNDDEMKNPNKLIFLYQEDVEILSFILQLLSKYTEYIQAKLSTGGFSSPVGHLLACQYYMLAELFDDIVVKLQQRKEDLDIIIDVIEKEYDK